MRVRQGLQARLVRNLDRCLVLAVDRVGPMGAALVEMDVEMAIHVVAFDRIVIDAGAKAATAIADSLESRLVIQAGMGAAGHRGGDALTVNFDNDRAARPVPVSASNLQQFGGFSRVDRLDIRMVVPTGALDLKPDPGPKVNHRGYVTSGVNGFRFAKPGHTDEWSGGWIRIQARSATAESFITLSQVRSGQSGGRIGRLNG